MLFAQFRDPFQRSLEALAVLYHVFCIIFLPTIIIIALSALFFIFTSYCVNLLPYAVWFYYDIQAPFRGSYPFAWHRKLAIWRWFCNYFPITLVKTAELPPDQNYIFASHPHGVLSLGVFGCFATNGNGFDELFPGIKPAVCTLNFNFYIPFKRELTMAFGAISASKESISYQLNRERKGHAVVLVIGGAAEALHANPDNCDLIILRRKGFITQALQHGAHLVPVFHFGENKTYIQLQYKPGSYARGFQEGVKRVIGFSPVLFRGGGDFRYCFGLLPYRVPIHTVVGAPIPVEKVEKPTKFQIEELHQKYCEALLKLFDDHKCNYGISPDTKLNMI